jgi:phage shock protein PspC (stress-responsive transcriptional regulator)
MARKHYRYSLQRRDAKVAGVCATLGDRFGVDPTFIRIGAIAAFLFMSWEFTLVAYAALGIWLAVDRKRNAGRQGLSEFDRMGDLSSRRPSVHAIRTELDESDRRRMAVDHHLVTQNDELAREIEALREEK